LAAVLDSHLEGRRFIVGDNVAVTDCVTAHLIDWANELRLIDNLLSCAPISNGCTRVLQRHNVSPKRSMQSAPRDADLFDGREGKVALLDLFEGAGNCSSTALYSDLAHAGGRPRAVPVLRAEGDGAVNAS